MAACASSSTADDVSIDDSTPDVIYVETNIGNEDSSCECQLSIELLQHLK